MSIFDRGIVFINYKKEMVLNCDSQLGRKSIKDLRILLLLFFTFLTLSKKETNRKGNIRGRCHMKLNQEAMPSITGFHIHETFSCTRHSAFISLLGQKCGIWCWHSQTAWCKYYTFSIQPCTYWCFSIISFGLLFLFHKSQFQLSN